MPLLKGIPYTLHPNPSDLTDLPSKHQVFQNKFTGEIFSSYEDYIAQFHLFKKRLWTCEATGKSKLTFEEAMRSEKENSEKKIQLLLPYLPMELTKQAIQFIQGNPKKSMADLIDELLDYFSMRLFIGEVVQVDIEGSSHSKKGQILAIQKSKREYNNTLDGKNNNLEAHATYATAASETETIAQVGKDIHKQQGIKNTQNSLEKNHASITTSTNGINGIKSSSKEMTMTPEKQKTLPKNDLVHLHAENTPLSSTASSPVQTPNASSTHKYTYGITHELPELEYLPDLVHSDETQKGITFYYEIGWLDSRGRIKKSFEHGYFLFQSIRRDRNFLSKKGLKKFIKDAATRIGNQQNGHWVVRRFLLDAFDLLYLDESGFIPPIQFKTEEERKKEQEEEDRQRKIKGKEESSAVSSKSKEKESSQAPKKQQKQKREKDDGEKQEKKEEEVVVEEPKLVYKFPMDDILLLSIVKKEQEQQESPKKRHQQPVDDVKDVNKQTKAEKEEYDVDDEDSMDVEVSWPTPCFFYDDIPQDLIGTVLTHWSFLNSFGQALNLMPFTFDEFCHGLTLKSSTFSVLISEIFGALLTIACSEWTEMLNSSSFHLLEENSFLSANLQISLPASTAEPQFGTTSSASAHHEQMDLDHKTGSTNGNTTTETVVNDKLSEQENQQQQDNKNIISDVEYSETERPHFINRAHQQCTQILQSLDVQSKICVDQWWKWQPGKWQSGKGAKRVSRGSRTVPDYTRLKAWHIVLIGLVHDWMDDRYLPGKWDLLLKLLGRNEHGDIVELLDGDLDEYDQINDTYILQEEVSMTQQLEEESLTNVGSMYARLRTRKRKDISYDEKKFFNDADFEDEPETVVKELSTEHDRRSKRPRRNVTPGQSAQETIEFQSTSATGSQKKFSQTNTTTATDSAASTKAQQRQQDERDLKKAVDELSRVSQYHFQHLSLKEKLFLLDFLIEICVCPSATLRRFTDQRAEYCVELRKELRDVLREKKAVLELKKEWISREKEETKDENTEEGEEEVVEDEGDDASDDEGSDAEDGESSSKKKRNANDNTSSANTTTKSRIQKMKEEREHRERQEKARLARLEKLRAESSMKYKLAKARAEERRKIEQQEAKVDLRKKQIELKLKMEYSCHRLKPLGRDRFFNRYWWFDTALGSDPLQIIHSGSNSRSKSSNTVPPMPWNSGRLFVEYFELNEEKLLKEAENGQDENKFVGGVDVGLELVKKGVSFKSKWGYYTEPEQIDQLLEFLDSRGTRESILIKSLERNLEEIAVSMTNRNAFIIQQHVASEKRSSSRKPMNGTSHDMTYVNLLAN